MIYDDDADLHLLDGKTVAIIGYGSQGHAHALNLKDSGIEVVVGLRPDSASVAEAREQGLEVTTVVEAASRGDLVMILLPDEVHRQAWGGGRAVPGGRGAKSRGDLVMILLPDELHRQVWEAEISDGIAAGDMLLFGHGFSIHYNEITPPPGVDVAMVAP